MKQTIQKQPEYVIRAFPNISKRKEIDEHTFTELKAKAEILKILWHMENSYALIGQTYKNFEMSLFEISFDFEHGNWDSRGIGWSGQQKIHINLMALLNTMYTYLNILETSHVKKLKKLTSEDMSDIENQISHSYDTRIECRIMKALRNYITHTPYANIRGSINIKMENKTSDLSRCRGTSNPAVVIEILLDGDRALEKKCKKDLMQMKQDGYNQFDVKFMLRGYIEEVAKIHSVFREKTEPLFNDILGALSEIEIDMFPDAEVPSRIQLAEFNTKNENEEPHDIGHEHHSRLKDRRREWRNFDNEQNRYYSSEVIAKNEKYPKEDKNLWITD